MSDTTQAEEAAMYRWLRAGNYSLELARRILNDTPHGIDAAIRQAMADDAAGVREGGAPQPTPYGLAGIEGDALVIRFTADACAFAFANDPQANDPRPLVVDKRQFLRDTLSEVTAEREDGQTPLTDMLDRAMVKAMENGSDALDYDAAGVAPTAPVAYGTIAERAAAGKDAGWWDTSGVTPSDDAKALSDAVNEIDRLNRLLEAIGDYAHDHSTGPAVPDALWEVRRMAYEGETTAGVRDTGEGPPHG